MHTVKFTLWNAHCKMHTCKMHTCEMHTVKCTLWNALWIAHCLLLIGLNGDTGNAYCETLTVKCLLWNAHCKMYTVKGILWKCV